MAALALAGGCGGGDENGTPGGGAYTIEVRDGEPVGGVQQIVVEAGGNVELTVSADVADEVHVHGYDVTADVAPGEDATLELVADIEGIFEIELEERALLIAKLEVRPL
jgi:hypothetical protein